MSGLPRVEWPGGARVAMVLHVSLQQSERPSGTYAARAKDQLAYCSTLSPEWLEGGAVDPMLQSLDRYAGEVGIWRLIELLDKYEVPATGPFNGLSAKRYPEATKAFVRGGPGREIAPLAWSADTYLFPLCPDKIRADVRNCINAFIKVTGERPVGWVSPGGLHNEHTLPILAEEGFIWHCDSAATDTPLLNTVNGKKMVEMTLPWEVNDTMFVKARVPPSHYVEIFSRQFDKLYEEGGQIVAAVAHCQIFGHPFGAWAFEQVIKYAKSFPGVWFTTRRGIAEWFLKTSK